MKNSKIIVSAVLIALSLGSKANWPGNSILVSDKTFSSVVLKKASLNFAKEGKRSLSEKSTFKADFSNKLNAEYTTGQTKAEESAISRVLHWDFKVKFQLSRNMNIIFSYN